MPVRGGNILSEERTRVSRRNGLALGAASALASFVSVSVLAAKRSKLESSEPHKEGAMPDKTAIRPFHFEASKDDLADLKRRVAATRWPDKETVPDQSQGVQLAIARKIQEHWAKHDWRKLEARMMAHPHFITEIDGLDIHFIHVKSKHATALPMIVTHGWPGSIV